MSNSVIPTLINNIKIPELDETRKELEKPDAQIYAQEIQKSYLKIIEALSRLSPNDLSLITKCRDEFVQAGLTKNSASHISVDDLVEIGGVKIQKQIVKYVRTALDEDSDLFKKAMAELTRRMVRGHELAVKGATLVDGDPEADTVIWGHTKGIKPKAVMHLVFCHFLERAVSIVLAESSNPKIVELGKGKDYFLNIMKDVLRFETAKGRGDGEITNIWGFSRENGGLQWSTKGKQEIFNKIVNK